MLKPRKKLGEILVAAGVVRKDELERVLAQRTKEDAGKRLGDLLVEARLCTEEHIAGALSSQLGLSLIDMQLTPIEPEAVERLSEDLARKHLVMPVGLQGRTLTLAMADPLSMDALSDVRFYTNLNVVPCVATRGGILWAINQHYQLDRAVDEIAARVSGTTVVEVVRDSVSDALDMRELEKRSRAVPIVRIVNSILHDAAEAGASDIHIEPAGRSVTVRLRIDGYLRPHIELPKWVQGAVVSRVKVLARMDITEKRVPQDGRIKMRIGARTIDLRISTLPTNYGEKIVVRLLDPASSPAGLGELGLEGIELERLLDLVSRPQGMLLVTGPTGSGKTTTLYGALTQMRDITKNVVTVEDPIEYELAGINQVGVDEKAGRTFATILPSILRQDPDVIMIGEMRDFATAAIAMQASLTGHLVLSTIHTNNSIASITRLRNLGVPSYLIASAVDGILAQRLVRKICPRCRVEEEPGEEQLRRLGLSREWAARQTFHRGRGCPACHGTGYSGRTGIYEFLLFSRAVREQVAGDATEGTLRQLALAEGMTPLVHAGIARARAGVTSLAEVVRVTQTDLESVAVCPDCGHMLGSGFVACPACGHRLIHTCPKCTALVDPHWRVCPYCAQRRGDEEEMEQQPEQEQAA
ncbi:MAG: Flp pilus assembly complex ATPase component TadA [Candidatus Eisenbacteria bacterium]|uniref:Flp pilus assembly complex ATPase component TadA n=1 Tax=Eiseniibacteriota bacterium TaxID=2212470 RepID=A0A937X9J0_UNCEI|nr:Flp pilus assembly complex ATPase component TadA [Candidatus Eisenbacteria bacterium]